MRTILYPFQGDQLPLVRRIRETASAPRCFGIRGFPDHREVPKAKVSVEIRFEAGSAYFRLAEQSPARAYPILYGLVLSLVDAESGNEDGTRSQRPASPRGAVRGGCSFPRRGRPPSRRRWWRGRQSVPGNVRPESGGWPGGWSAGPPS
jgi:hypothetical protein